MPHIVTRGFIRLLFLLVALDAPLPAAAITLVRLDSRVNVDDQTVTFRIEFSQPPDFSTVDEFGRQANSFQFYVDNDAQLTPGSGTGSDSIDVIVRGAEIHIDGDLRIRDRNGEGGPESGGWGPIRGSVPIEIDGGLVTFTIDFPTLDETDGVFNYLIDVFDFGGGVHPLLFAESGAAVPEPATAFLVTMGIVGLGVLRGRRAV